jgi:hypothetical protein
MKEEIYPAIALFKDWIVKKMVINENGEHFIMLRPPKGHFDNCWSKDAGFINIYHPLTTPKDWIKIYRGYALEGFYREGRKLFCKLTHKKKGEVLWEVIDTWVNNDFYKQIDHLKMTLISKLPN